MNTNSIVMWETLPNNADWDCFTTPILRVILRIQNRLLEEHCALLEVIHLFQSVGCVRNKLQFRTVQQNQQIISLDAGLRLDGIHRTLFMGSDRRSSSRKHESEPYKNGETRL